jgi:hypothetical protein
MVSSNNMNQLTAMFRIFIFTALTAGFCVVASADIPKKAPINKYAGLWSNSPFTSKPPPVQAGPVVNPLEDFTLSGISPVPGGYRITIISKKNPELKKVIEPGGKSEFTVVSVNRDPSKSLGTTVVLASGGMQGTVSFEKEMLTLKAPPAPQQQPQQQNLPPGITPAQAGQDANSTRQPRPRIVPPPTPAATNSKNTKSEKDQRSDRRR